MFQVSHPSATTSTTRILLALVTTTALAAGPVASATASPEPEPSGTQTTQISWQETANELAAQARSTTSLVARRMLHTELTIVMHSHRDW